MAKLYHIDILLVFKLNNHNLLQKEVPYDYFCNDFTDRSSISLKFPWVTAYYFYECSSLLRIHRSYFSNKSKLLIIIQMYWRKKSHIVEAIYVSCQKQSNKLVKAFLYFVHSSLPYSFQKDSLWLSEWNPVTFVYFVEPFRPKEPIHPVRFTWIQPPATT